MTFDWNQVRAFLATVEEGSLSAAARALGQTQPTLGRQVAALEEALGLPLFERAGRSLILTQSGEDLLDHVRAMGEAASRISLAASGQSQAIDGRVSITASDGMSAYFLPKVLKTLRATAPGITIDVVSSNAIQDLQRREADIAIRHVQPDQPDLIAKRVRNSTGHLYAATRYLDARGRPETADDLADHDFIGLQNPERFTAEINRRMGLNLSPDVLKITSDSGVAGWEMVKQGLGITVMMKDLAEATPGIEKVLPDLPAVEVPVWLTVHRELRSSRRIRVVFDALAEALAKPN
ncbi:MAG: LysR family transcriptional regulator [Rhodobacter sp.]|nr:LysR family transcriptional regulator [Rhodobacter sp.]